MLTNTEARTSHIKGCLDLAVPLWLGRVRGYTDGEALSRAHAAGEIIACYGDALMFGRAKFQGRDLISIWRERSKDEFGYRDNPFKPGPSPGEVFNVLAEALALAERLGCDDMLAQLARFTALSDDDATSDHRGGETWEQCKARRKSERAAGAHESNSGD